ncbi:MAG: hypothetical protein AABW51_02865 [Nanoarchaeota archaeon]
MVDKKTIGKIQLVIGILVIILSIISIFIVNNWFSQVRGNIDAQNQELMFLSVNLWTYYLWTFFGLTMLIALLFITQGLVNISNGT